MITDKTLKEYFSDSFSTFSERPALTCINHTLNYRELNELSTEFAVYLHCRLELKPGDKIAIQLPNLLQYPVIILAAIKAGIIIVNINPLYTPEELSHQLNDAQVKVIVLLSSLTANLNSIIHETMVQHIVVTKVGDLLPPAKGFFLNSFFKLKQISTVSFYSLRTILHKEQAQRIPNSKFKAKGTSKVQNKKQPQLKSTISFLSALSVGRNKNFPPLPALPLTPQSLAILQYTGGTTGVSKGAMLSHHNLLSNVQQIKASFDNTLQDGQEIIVTPLPIYHIFCFMVCIIFGFGIGAHLILIPDPRQTNKLISAIKDIPFTFFIGLNTLFNNLCRHKKFRKLNFSNLKVTISGGMALIKETALTWQTITNCKIIEGYGLTEASPVVSLNPYGAPRLGTVGKLLKGTECRFIDANGQDVKRGEPGELLVRGPQVMIGYWQNPTATHETIDQAGWLHTGDVALENDEGYLSIVDRIKDMIIVSGFNVYPNELEEAISKHPDIIECAVIGIKDSDSAEAVKLFVVTANPDLTPKDIRKFAHTTLCSYKVPKYIEFVTELPKSNIGKVLRSELRNMQGK